jgi:hypothetical protein
MKDFEAPSARSTGGIQHEDLDGGGCPSLGGFPSPFQARIFGIIAGTACPVETPPRQQFDFLTGGSGPSAQFGI